MTSYSKSKNDQAWEKLFDKYDILSAINHNNQFTITADQIKEFREPRLMAKFDHEKNLPSIFKNNKLAILPNSRGSYIIGKFNLYHSFETALDLTPEIYNIPPEIQSISIDNIFSESIALNAALVSGIIEDFLNDYNLMPTVSGRMGSDSFSFNVASNSSSNDTHRIDVQKSQIEIDAGYEGINSLALVEAKLDLSDDFLIRQIYYPYRVWQPRVNKQVRPIFLSYSNGIYNLYEYKFNRDENYNSISLVNHKLYALEDIEITTEDIVDCIKSTNVVVEPRVPFPQADKFERIINLCELLFDCKLTHNDITAEYDFDRRQTDYYTNAAIYLGLISKETCVDIGIQYSLTDMARQIFKLKLKQRQIEFVKLIVKHEAFKKAALYGLDTGGLLHREKVVEIMKSSNLYNVESDSTYNRRASTVIGWCNWIYGISKSVL